MSLYKHTNMQTKIEAIITQLKNEQYRIDIEITKLQAQRVIVSKMLNEVEKIQDSKHFSE